jgi:hypothetical protein
VKPKVFLTPASLKAPSRKVCNYSGSMVHGSGFKVKAMKELLHSFQEESATPYLQAMLFLNNLLQGMLFFQLICSIVSN